MPFIKRKPLTDRQKYDLPVLVELEEGDLWGIRPELVAYDYTSIMLKIVGIEQKTTYAFIKTIFTNHGLPCDCGQLITPMCQLEKANKIVVKRNKVNYTITIV